jgi:hypothetical protein
MIDIGTFNAVLTSDVAGAAAVKEGVEVDGVGEDVDVASESAEGELVAGAFVVAMLKLI